MDLRHHVAYHEGHWCVLYHVSKIHTGVVECAYLIQIIISRIITIY
jgi:hypothetical protein